jgi:hypothetical protein
MIREVSVFDAVVDAGAVTDSGTLVPAGAGAVMTGAGAGLVGNCLNSILVIGWVGRGGSNCAACCNGLEGLNSRLTGAGRRIGAVFVAALGVAGAVDGGFGGMGASELMDVSG